jgi:hypothetical protein
VYPNPNAGNYVSIGYTLPQNKSGVFEIIDVTGKVVFTFNLPPWSNEQGFKLPMLGGGVYGSVLRSGGFSVSKKLVVIRE